MTRVDSYAVTYTGEYTQAHGQYMASPCDCELCCSEAWITSSDESLVAYDLMPALGGPRYHLSHVLLAELHL